MPFVPTRAAALQQLEDFAPLAAKYSSSRNFDLGAGNHSGVSRLSPYIRTRLITEQEATRVVLKKHSPHAAGKFLQEIAWRTYWKGWLEMRPAVWRHYTSTLAGLEKQKELPNYRSATSAETGIKCFDHWVNELTATGYLHNHARMWFASIWIFTLKLPWQLGADFFLKNLFDADPASNTLSWRWVAGLHTKGKHYLARASNIAEFTNGRFNPASQLNESADAITEDTDFEKQPLSLPNNPTSSGRTGHLMFPDDLAPPPKSIGKITATAAFVPTQILTTPLVEKFITGAINDTLHLARGTLLTGPFESAVNDWISAEKLDSIVISLPTVGPTRDFFESSNLQLKPEPFVRSWDRQLWPKATAGFFKFRKQLPEIHQAIIDSGDLT
ncbi:FAD-binding domain-containing protein [Luteolibacter sp. AS25]|uniref:FAD-binding domain-containing protein n=1 Tax=Luteolibacter sp. AS25 TaxID=3135776 RepID=UPI00398AAD7E